MLLVSISIVGDLILKKDCHHYHVCAILYACQSIKHNGKFDDILNEIQKIKGALFNVGLHRNCLTLARLSYFTTNKCKATRHKNQGLFMIILLHFKIGNS